MRHIVKEIILSNKTVITLVGFTVSVSPDAVITVEGAVVHNISRADANVEFPLT